MNTPTMMAVIGLVSALIPCAGAFSKTEEAQKVVSAGPSAREARSVRWIDIFDADGNPEVAIPRDDYALLKTEGDLSLYGRIIADTTGQYLFYEFVQGRESDVADYIAEPDTDIEVSSVRNRGEASSLPGALMTRAEGRSMRRLEGDEAAGGVAVAFIPVERSMEVTAPAGTCINKSNVYLSIGGSVYYYIYDVDESTAQTVPVSGDADIDLYERIWSTWSWEAGSYKGGSSPDYVEDEIDSDYYDGDYKLKVYAYSTTTFSVYFCGYDW